MVNCQRGAKGEREETKRGLMAVSLKKNSFILGTGGPAGLKPKQKLRNKKLLPLF